jgi:hypothetical protein
MQKVLIFSVCLILSLLIHEQVFSHEISLRNIILGNVAGKINLRYELYNSNWESLTRYLNDGANLVLECKAKISKVRIMWMDQVKLSKKLIFELKYNPLSQEYILHNLTQKRTMHNSDLGTLLKGNWSRLTMDLGAWKSLKKGADYIFNLKIRFKKSDIPKWLKNALFFWSWDVLPEIEYQITFEY